MMSKAKEIAEARYASGEITLEEYRSIIANLDGGSSNVLNPPPAVDVGVPAAQEAVNKTKWPVIIEAEDGVVSLQDYSGVKSDLEFITYANFGIGVVLLFLSLKGGQTTFLIGIGLIALAVWSVFFTKSVKVMVMTNGNWSTVAKYTFARAEQVKRQLIDAMA